MAYMDPIGTVDGRNPAPVDVVNIPVFIGFYTMVQDFFHQQCHHNTICEVYIRVSIKYNEVF